MLLLTTVCGVLGFFLFAGVEKRADYPDSPLVGKAASDFQLPDIRTGEVGGLDRYSGKPVVLNFWASWCTSCKTEVQELEAMHRSFTGQIHVVGIAIQDTLGAATNFMDQYGQTFPSLIDSTGEVAVEYGIIGLPETFVLDGAGKIVHKFLGPVTRDMLESVLRDSGLVKM